MWLIPLHTRILANTFTSPVSSPTLEQQLYFLTTLCQPSLPLLWSQLSLRSGALFPSLHSHVSQEVGACFDLSSCKSFISLALPPSFWALGFLARSPYCIILLSCVYGSLPSPPKVSFSTKYFLNPFRGPEQRVPDSLFALSWEEPLSPN